MFTQLSLSFLTLTFPLQTLHSISLSSLRKETVKILLVSMIASASQAGDYRRKFSGKAPASYGRKFQNLPEEKHSGGARRFVPNPLMLKLPLQNGDALRFRPSKMLVNVTMENSSGAIQMLMLVEDTVGDLIKAALELYEKEKRRPFLKNTDPKCYHLHYSSFTLESLKRDCKLMNLGSRNFFLCLKPPTSSCFEKEKVAMDSAFPWMIFVPLLL